MRILIDLQGCQSSSRHRGIGRYSMSLAQSMARNAGSHEVWILLNGLLSESVGPVKAALHGLVPDDRLVVFHAPGPVAEMEARNLPRARQAELIRESVIAMLAPDVVHVSSLFEGFVDDAVTSAGVLPIGPPVAVTLYDLIPWVNSAHHFQNTDYRDNYLRKVESLKKAGMLLAISRASAQEAHRELEIPASRIANIGSAINTEFRVIAGLEIASSVLCRENGINRPFVFYVGNVEPHKNISGLVEAYAMLPPERREQYQLAVLVNADAHERVRSGAAALGIEASQLVLLSGIDDGQLVELYNLCYLFVLPSLHEGFGLPALEAMACGAPAIGSNTTSIPEVIGREDALFDPRSSHDISRLMNKVLSEPDFHAGLKAHAAAQSRLFSWDETGRKALSALEALVAGTIRGCAALPDAGAHRRKLAMVTPMPPEQTGIADYSVELLRALSAHYDITLITPQATVDFPAECLAGGVQAPQWLDSHAGEFERIVYQLGNSPFHAHMFALNERHPGIVDLHDFFLSAVLDWMERTAYAPGAFVESAFLSSGLRALTVDKAEGRVAAIRAYPGNYPLLNSSCGVIVHSNYPCQMAAGFYGPDAARDWVVVPHARILPDDVDRAAARRSLGLDEDDFLVCAFGFIDASKLNHELVDAWKLAHPGAHGKRLHLVFVGQNEQGEYGATLLRKLAELEGTRTSITGFASPGLYNTYQASADAAIQLRTMSRGETSGTVLDCLAHGTPLLIVANGGMAEYPDDIVMKLRDGFAQQELVDALRLICGDGKLRERLSRRGPDYIRQTHKPEFVARLYSDAIEKFAANPAHRRYRELLEAPQLQATLADAQAGPSLRAELDSIHSAVFKRKLYVDMSSIVKTDLKTGIERVVRGLFNALVAAPPPGFDVEPVYMSNAGGRWRYRVAREYVSRSMGLEPVWQGGDVVVPRKGDVLFGADLAPEGVIGGGHEGVYAYWRACGASVNFMVYDLLPISHPEFFPPGAGDGHLAWLRTIVAEADGLVCISRAVADDVRAWIAGNSTPHRQDLKISHVHLGADIDGSSPTTGLPPDAGDVLAGLELTTTFLMVGTIEPRKGYLQALSAFELLWAAGRQVNLVIVGGEGWKPVPHEMRRTIPEIVSRLRGHAELGKRLHWLEGVSDEYLEAVYKASDCLLVASEGEGFGLPLIEAARHGIPILARNLAVFHEVAGSHASYFTGNDAPALAAALTGWIESEKLCKSAGSAGLKGLTWAQSAAWLLRELGIGEGVRHA